MRKKNELLCDLPVITKLGEMSVPPHPICCILIASTIATWNGIEWGGMISPDTIRLVEKGPPHLQLACGKTNNA